MRIDAVIQILAALVVAVSASPISTRSNHVVHERRAEPPPNWLRHSRLHPAVIFTVRIGLTQQNLHRAEEFINQVAHPESPNYGKHWSAQKIAGTFAPSTEAVDAVKSWLSESGIELSRVKMSKSRNWLVFNATASEAESLLKTEYHLYNHNSGHRHVACEQYSIPSHLTEHIDIVTPTVHFDKRIGMPRRLQKHENLPAPLRELNRRTIATPHGLLGSPEDSSNPKQGPSIVNALMTLDNCDTMIMPACLRALYNAPAGSSAIKNNSLGVVEYTPQAFLQSDLDIWFKQFSPSQVGQSPTKNLIDGAVIQTQNQNFSFNGESALDLQYAMALVSPQTTTLFQVGDLVEGASFNNFLDALDGSYCTFDGGDSKDPNVDGQYPDKLPGGFNGPENCGGVAVRTPGAISFLFCPDS
jgi:tripeptidyl-peptidase-1